MSGAIETQESLGAGLEKHVSRVSDLEQTIKQLKQDLPSLKRQCDRFKTEKASLLTEITSLRSERDTLRLEVAHEYQQNTHLKEEYLVSELDGQGKANRRIWMLEQQNAELKREMDSLRGKHVQEIEKERNVSSGLRDRIGNLDEKRKRIQDALSASEKREAQLRSDVEHYKSARDPAVRPDKVDLINGVNKLVEAAPPVAPSPRCALQKRSSNISLATPATPTRTPRMPSAPPSTVKKRPTPLSPASLAKRCTMLEERCTRMRNEYEQLRTKYQEDIKHWKDWKALDNARREEKKKRKEERSNRRHSVEAKPVRDVEEPVMLVPPSQESANSEQPTTSQEPSGSQRVTRSQAKKRKAEEARQSSDHDGEPEEDYIESATAVVHVPGPPKMPSPSQNRRAKRIQRHDTPDHQLTPLPRVRQAETVRKTPLPDSARSSRKATPAARVTPWLGSETKTRSSSGALPTATDPFDVDLSSKAAPLKRQDSTVLEETRTPLVRDRGEGPTSSLRRTALARTFSTEVHDLQIESSRHRDSVSPLPDTLKKRRLDMEGLTPAQKAQERKRINKMTPSEKRALYADYKGKGRYLPPEEVLKTVADEYTINPKENEGVTYQYHDVKRGRAERKQMHGGDCECCADYYREVGALPRYNAGPAWKDSSPTDDPNSAGMTEAQVREHQNKVSRHRETWARPPTPPGYWEIAFPTTQAVVEQNKQADGLIAEKEARIAREASHRNSKWKKVA